MDTNSPESPAAPTDIGTVASGSIDFNWTEPTDDGFGVESYFLEIGTSPGAADAFSGNLGEVLTYNYNSGSHGVTYYARVKAIDKAGNESNFSSTSDGILLDNIVPSVTSFVVANEASDGYLNFAEVASVLDFAPAIL